MSRGYGGSAGLVLQDENTSFQNTPCNFREVFLSLYHKHNNYLNTHTRKNSLCLVIPFNTYVFCRMCGIRHLYQRINLFCQNSLDILISMLYTNIVVNVMLNARKPV